MSTVEFSKSYLPEALSAVDTNLLSPRHNIIGEQQGKTKDQLGM